MRLSVSYSVIKMADHQGYAIHTHHIPVDVFLDMIESNIKKLIHTHGHKDCGLRHEELCKEIKKIIHDNKQIVFQYMDPHSKVKWSKEWDSRRSIYFNKLFDNEGFINMCFPFKNIVHQDLYQLQSRHVNFCKEKDERLSALGKNPPYSECVEYNSWIETEKSSFTHEYLNNVSIFKSKTVDKYFSTKDHPRGHDPRRTYNKSKLDCEIYNPASNRYQKKAVKKEPTNELQPPMESNIISGSQGKDGNSPTDKDSGNAKTKTEENIPPKFKPHTPNSHIPSHSKTQRVDTSTVQDNPVKTEDPGSPVSKDDEKKGATMKSEPPTKGPLTAQAEEPPQAKSSSRPPNDTSPTSAIQIVPVPTATTSPSSTLATVKDTTSSQTTPISPSLTTSASSLNSDSPSTLDPLSPADATKDQNRTSHSTTTSDAIVTKHSTKTIPAPSDVVSSLVPPQLPTKSTPPAVTSAQGLATPESSSASTVTITTVPPTATNSIMSTAQNPISSSNEAPGVNMPQKPPLQVASEHKATEPNKDPQQTPLSSPTPTADKDTEANSAADASPKPKGSIKVPGIQLPRDENQASGHPSIKSLTIPDGRVQKNQHKIDQQNNTSTVQKSSKISVVSLASDRSGASVTSPNVNTKTATMDDSKVRTDKNDNPSIISEEIPPLTHIIPTLLVILATVILLFQLYKYTPFGFLLGRRKKRKKQDLRRIIEIPEKPTYESLNITVHELEDSNLVGQTVENDVYTKLLKINRYKQEMQKRKNENKKTLIEVHMEVLEEYKSDEWELHKGDFLEICLRGFINEENDNYSKLPNTELTAKSTKNDKIIEDIQKKEILWNNWIENHRNVLEQWKKEDWFQNLKNEWKNEEQMYKKKNYKSQKNTLNEHDTHSIVIQKDLWKQWISKQATHIDMFNKEDWFKSIIYAQDKEKNNYHINEYNDISVTNKTELKNEKRNHEYSRSKDIIQKLMVQIHMMVLEECIKEEIIRNKELSIDNFIEDIHNQNNYDEKRNMPQCDTDNFKNITPDFPCTHAEKCATIYKDNIISCSYFEDEFCKKLKAFRDILMNQLLSPSMFADQQDIIFSIDKKMAESTSQNQREEFSQATTISAASFGTVMGVSLLSLFLHKVTPLFLG
ncbi:STP1 protein [Plasmodium ovale wallikeri]|uniref:STP1 protein n=1 Tax=Plasmodium ovale wallikeri TaxID=864142 RepID=A0A1A9AP14_PLAOA|nr:STP1 protein [Plasmodium ovale wallikeri]